MTNNLTANAGISRGRLEVGEAWGVFVDRVAAGHAPADAARLAGYDEPERMSAELLRLPAIRKALAATIDGRLLSEAAPLALKVAVDILKDEKAPPSIRGKMAISVLDRVKDKEPEGADRGNLANLSQEALARLIGQMEEAGAVVVPRNVTPGRTVA